MSATGVLVGEFGGRGCEHKYVYLRNDVEKAGRVRSHFDVFFCEKCLQHRRVLKFEQWYNGDGRWITHPKLEYA